MKVRVITLAALLLAGCASLEAAPEGGGGAAAATVTGTVTYRERIALPPNAVIKVQLVDVSRADAPSIVHGEQVLQSSGRQPPFAFEISYDPAKIVANYTYGVQARIEVDGKLRFVSDQHYAVITRGAPTHVDMVLKSIGN